MSNENLPVPAHYQGDPEDPRYDRQRRKSWKECTKDDLSRYLDELERCGTPTIAAKRVGITDAAVQEHRMRSPAFRDALAEVEAIIVEELEAEALRRAKDAMDPASGKLLIFFLQNLKPDTYGTKITVQGVEAASQAEIRRLQLDAQENPEEYAAVAARMAEAMRREIADNTGEM